MASPSLLQHASHFSLLILLLCPLLHSTRSDFASDVAECGDKLLVLMTCLPYIHGSSKAPTPECCNSLKGVLVTSNKCICILVKDRNNPQLGIKFNDSLALALPSVCGSPINFSDCPKLLNLPPNSTDAQIFYHAGSQAAGGSATEGAGKANSVGGGNTNAGERKNQLGWGGGIMESGVEVMALLALLLVILNS